MLKFAKTIINNQKYSIIALLSIICFTEILINFNNRLLQIIGICNIPFIVGFVYFILKQDQRKGLN